MVKLFVPSGTELTAIVHGALPNKNSYPKKLLNNVAANSNTTTTTAGIIPNPMSK